MVAMILVTVWTSFVALYLVWQQLSGDLAGDAGSRRQPATGHTASAPVVDWGLMAER